MLKINNQCNCSVWKADELGTLKRKASPDDLDIRCIAPSPSVSYHQSIVNYFLKTAFSDRFFIGRWRNKLRFCPPSALVRQIGWVAEGAGGVAAVIDEQLVATDVSLAHRDRELAFPDSVQLAAAGVAVALRTALDALVPEDRQRDVLSLELAMDARPVGLDLPPLALLRAGVGVQPRLQRGIGHIVGQRPAQPGSPEASDCRADRRRGHSNPTGDLAGRCATNELQPKHFAHVAYGRSLC